MDDANDEATLSPDKTPMSSVAIERRADMLQKILDLSLDITCTIDRDGRFVHISLASESTWGYSPEKLIGQPLSAFVVEEDRERTREAFATAVGGHRLTEFENRCRHQSGRIVDMQWSARWDVEDALVYCSAHDVTERRRTERALLQSEQNYRSLFNTSPLPKWIYDLQSICIVDVNETAVSQYGFSHQEFLGKKITDLLPADEAQRLLDAHVGISRAPGTVCFGLFTHIKSSGAVVRVEMYGHSTRFNDSDCVTATCIDVTERERALAQLHATIERFEFVTKATSDVVWDWDVAQQQMYRGEGVDKLFGYDEEQVSSDHSIWIKHVHPDDRTRIEEGIERAMADGSSYWQDEYRFHRRDGSTAYVQDRAIVVRNDAGEAVRVVGAMQDITRQKEEEQRLRLLESVITNTRDSVLITTTSPMDEPGPAIVYVNEAFTRMTGYEIEEVIGKSPRFLQGPNSNADALHALGEAMRRFEPCEIETINYKKNGEEFWINFSVSPVADKSGEFTHFIAIERDVTERKHRELKKALFADIAFIFNKSELLAETLCEALTRLSEFGDYDLAEAWLVGANGERIVLQGFSTPSDSLTLMYDAMPDVLSVARGEGLPGITWTTGEIQAWSVSDTARSIGRRNAFMHAGLTTIYGLPLQHHNETIGVLILGTSRAGDSTKSLSNFLSGFEEQFCAEIRRKQLEEELNRLFNFAPDIICIIGVDGFYRRVNPIMCSILGYSETELLENAAIIFVHPEDRKRTLVELELLGKGEGSLYFENRQVTRLNEVKWLGWTASPATEEGHIFAVAKDITEKKQLEQLLEKTTNMARVGSWELDLVNGRLWWSTMTRAIHEVDDAFEPQLSTALTFYTEEDQPVITKLVDECVRNGTPFDEELRIRTARDQVRWVRAIGGGEFLDGRCIKLMGIFQDIHERKQAQEAVVTALSERTTVLESIGDGFITLDRNWIVTYWNAAAGRMLGTPSEEIVGKYVWDMYADAVETKFYSEYHRAIEENVAVHFEEYYATVNKWFEIDAYPSAAGLAVYVRDITLRRQADERLLQSNERFERIAQATNDAIWDWDIVQDRLIWGDGMRTVFGHVYDEGVTKIATCTANMHPDDVEAVMQSLYAVLQNPLENRWQYDYRYRRTNGSWAYVVDIGSVIRDRKGKAIRMVGAMQDITHRRQYEESLKVLNDGLQKSLTELERSNKELEQFAYVASHDLQEPLRMVTSFLTQLERKYHDQLDEKAHTYIHFATDGAKRMRQIILDLLEYSRAGRSDSAKEDVDVDSVLMDVVILFERRIEESNASVTWGPMPVIQTQRVPLRQLFQNLIGNALTYQAAENAPIVKIAATELASEWRFSVADNGIGISSDYFDKVFQIFQRLHNQEEYSGTGMGLAICKKIVDNLGGKIWLDSTEGEGTVFFFTIPKRGT